MHFTLNILLERTFSATECYDLHVEIIKRYEKMCTMSDKIFVKKQIQIDEGAYTSEKK